MDQTTPPETRTTWSRITASLSKFFRSITVEPVLACYIIPSVLASLSIANLNLEKACRVNKNYGDEVCNNLTHHIKSGNSTEEIEVQALVAYMNAWKMPLQTAIPAIAVLFIGAWSDRTRKRKPYLLIPMLGEFITSIGLIFCTYFFLQWPLEVAGVIEGLPPALTGGSPMMFMAIFCYIADNTTEEDRTFRIGLVNVFISIAIPIGTALSGVLLTELGFYGVFSICLGIYIIGFVYGSTRVHDLKLDKDEGQVEKARWVEMLNWRLVYDTFMLMFKKRKMSRRLRTNLLLLVYILVAGPVHGAGSLLYFYCRLRFNMDELEFSAFSAYSIVINLLGVIIGLGVFTKYLKLDDNLIAIIACVSKILANFLYAFAPTSEWLYVAPLIEIVGGTGIIAMRSISTKIVEPNETGKINSLFGICDAIVNAIYPSIFSIFYVKTADSFPGAFCILASFLLLPALIIFIYSYILQRKENKIEEENRTKEAHENLQFENELTTL